LLSLWDSPSLGRERTSKLLVMQRRRVIAAVCAQIALPPRQGIPELRATVNCGAKARADETVHIYGETPTGTRAGAQIISVWMYFNLYLRFFRWKERRTEHGVDFSLAFTVSVGSSLGLPPSRLRFVESVCWNRE
jgi:hypothetical protein